MSEEQQIKRVKVKLKKPHTHAGVEYDEAAIKAGVEIEVTENQSKALKDQGVI
jgi:predicted site-specific integrase-resolvase